MSDLIDRQKAIEALDFEIVHMTVFSNDDEKNITNPFAQYNKGLEDGIKAIRALPSAEPERKTKVVDIFCGNCGRALIGNEAYCDRCGCRLEWE